MDEPAARREDLRPIRVAYVLHNAERGGAAESLKQLIRSFAPGRVQPFVLCPPGPVVQEFRDIGATVHVVRAVSALQGIHGLPVSGVRLVVAVRAVWQARGGASLAAALDSIEPDLVHLNERGMFQAAWIAKHRALPVVMHARSVADRETRWLGRLAAWLDGRAVDRMVAIDESVRWSVREFPRSVVIYNPLPGAAAKSARAHDPSALRVRVTYLSGLVRAKGVWDVAHCARLLRDRKDIVFGIAGYNPRPAAYYRSLTGRLTSAMGLTEDVAAGLRAFVEREGLADTVQLLGPVGHTSDLLGRTDVLMFPSRTNGVGRSVFEAGVLGVPSVVSLEDRIPDIVEDGVTGLVTPVGDVEAMAAAVVRLADSPDLRRSLGQAAAARFRRLFDPRRSAEQVLELYRELVREPGSPPTVSHWRQEA